MDHKNRGMMLESILNKTFKRYAIEGIALFHKKSLPISFSRIVKDKDGKNIVKNAKVMSKSTIDYYGIYKGLFIAIEAKSTKNDRFPLTNIKMHQKRYLNQVSSHGGIALIVLMFSSLNEIYLLDSQTIFELKVSSLTNEDCKKYGQQVEMVYPGLLDMEPILSNWT